MAQQLKRWESPRRQGRNHKGKGGSARQRQLQKRLQNLRQQLKQNERGSNHSLFLCLALTPRQFLPVCVQGVCNQ